MTKIIYEEKDCVRIEIEVKEEGITACGFVSDIVKPLMLAIGYQPSNVMEALGEE